MSAIINIAENYFAENNKRYVFIDGHFCKKINDCYETLQQQLSFPGYFGNNLDALEEMLNDLDWIEEEKITIIVANENELLEKDAVKKDAFLDILNSCENEKMEIIYLGTEADS